MFFALVNDGATAYMVRMVRTFNDNYELCFGCYNLNVCEDFGVNSDIIRGNVEIIFVVNNMIIIFTLC